MPSQRTLTLWQSTRLLSYLIERWDTIQSQRESMVAFAERATEDLHFPVSRGHVSRIARTARENGAISGTWPTYRAEALVKARRVRRINSAAIATLVDAVDDLYRQTQAPRPPAVTELIDRFNAHRN